jgi:hypothetical protein
MSRYHHKKLRPVVQRLLWREIDKERAKLFMSMAPVLIFNFGTQGEHLYDYFKQLETE